MSRSFFTSAAIIVVLLNTVSASPAPALIFGRAIGDSCTAPEGTGSCQNTADCKGISYPAGLCPNDPDDVQCCVEITCNVPAGSGYCRSVSNNGCPGGTFHPGTQAPWPCPGDSDIVCCVPNSSTDPEPPADCKKTLSCTFSQIEAMSLQERLDYVRTMQSDFFGPLNCGNQFRAIEGVILFFQDEGLAEVGSWASYVDAGIVEGIQNGGNIALGLGGGEGGNPGSLPWASFMQRMKDGQLNNRDDHDLAWSEAEQAATEYGKKLGDDAGLEVGLQLQLWYWSTQLFRWIMRNRGTAINLLRLANPIFLFTADDFINWLTDITQIEPTLCGAKAVWTITDPATIAAILASGIPGVGVFANIEVIKAIIKIYQCFRDN